MNRLFPIVFIILIIFSLFVNFKGLQSSFLQGFLIEDFNSQQHRVPIQEIEKLDDNFPSISATTLPIKALKARYYLNIDSIEKAIRLNKESIKDNPFVKVSEAQLANIYFDLEQYDSSYYYSYDAFKALPNNNFHRDIYFRNLVKRKDSLELQEAFENIKDLNNYSHWVDYLISRYRIVGPNDEQIIKLTKEFEILFPQYTDNVNYRLLYSLLKVGGENMDVAANLNEIGTDYFNQEDYESAIIFYEKALEYDDTDYIIFENAGIANNLNENYTKAAYYFDKVIYEFKPGNGKSEYLKGLMLIKLDSLEKACDYLKRSSQLNYSGTGSLQVYNNFCN